MGYSTLDSKNICDEIEDFEQEHDELLNALEDHGEEPGFLEAALKLADVSDAEWERYKDCKAVDEDGRSAFGDWDYGVTLIPESDFTDYVEDLVKEIGDWPREVPSYIVIDWEATADNLKQDYSSIEIDGVTYLGR